MPMPGSFHGNRNLNRLWFAQSISLVGLQVGSLAVPLLAVDVLHASASQVALIVTVSTVPWLVLGPVVGALADRRDRRRLLIASHVGRGVLWLTIPAAYLAGVLTITQLLVISVLVGVLGIVFEVSYHAFLPNIVSRAELASANGKMSGTDAVARSAGPAVAGYLIEVISAPFTVVVQAVTSLLAAASTATIRVDAPPQPPEEARWSSNRSKGWRAWWDDIRTGFSCLWRIKPLRWLTIAEASYLFFFTLGFAVLVVFLRSTVGLDAASIGLMFSAGSIAGLLGAVLTPHLSTRFGLTRTLRGAAIARGTGLALLPVSLLVPDHTVIAVLIMGRAVNAGAWSVYEVLANSYQQGTLPDRHRGSATAAGLWLGRSTETVGAASAAVLADTINLTLLIAAAGIGATISGLLTLLANPHDPELGQPTLDDPPGEESPSGRSRWRP